MTTWKSLNDAFAEGTLEIWFMRPAHFRDGICGEKPDTNDLEATHILLGKIGPSPSTAYTIDDLDEVWGKLQGMFWSPNGEARNLIQSKGLEHTSMSVGDCFRFASGEVWIVARMGFEQVE
jgi:hypothetical protein